MDKSELAVRGAAEAPVTKDEVRRLILAAQAAWREQTRLGLCSEPFEAWRHGALWDAVRKASFRAVGQREFGLALGHFEKLAGKDSSAPGGRGLPGGAGSPSTPWGRTNAAIARRESGPEGDRRRAEYCLRRECGAVKEAFGGDPGQALAYALALLRKIHKVSLDQATGRQVWQVIFTLRSRAKAHARKPGAGCRESGVAEKEVPV